MRFKQILMVCSVVAAGLASAAPPPPPADANPDEIIRKFAAKEAEFRKARENYTYRQSVKMEELDADGNPEGKWEITSDIIFGPNKQRIEKVIYAPMITLRNLTLTPQDEQDLKNVQPFVLTTEDVDKYAIEYQLDAMERALDNAIAKGKVELRIIHGIGKGKLRDEIHKALSKHPQVKSFENAHHSRYGWGSTIVYFK